TMLLLHGLGSDERDMLGLAYELEPDLHVVCIRAPMPCPPGYAWFEINWTPNGMTMNREQFWASVDIIAAAIPQIGENLIVGGFSQGAMITVGLLLKYPDLVRHAVLLRGRG